MSVVEEISRRPGEKHVTARVKEDKNAYVFLIFMYRGCLSTSLVIAMDADSYSFFAELIRPAQAGGTGLFKTIYQGPCLTVQVICISQALRMTIYDLDPWAMNTEAPMHEK